MYSYSPFLSSYPYSPPMQPMQAPIQNYRPPIYHQPQPAYPVAGPVYGGPVSQMPADYSRFSSTVEHYDPGKPQKRIWNERIPYERAYVDYYEQRHVDYIPQERSYTDYIELEHQLDYIPVPQLQKRYEYLPVDRFKSTVDYQEVKNSQIVSNSQYGYGQGGGPSQYGYGAGRPGLLAAPASPQRNFY